MKSGLRPALFLIWVWRFDPREVLFPAAGVAAEGANLWPEQGEAFEEESWAEDADDHAKSQAAAEVKRVALKQAGQYGDQNEADGTSEDGKSMQLAADAGGSGGVIRVERESFGAARAVAGEAGWDE
jgi:hypothetical protein